MLSPSFSSRFRYAMLAGASAVFLFLLTGCGAGLADGNGYGDGANAMAGIVHGGPNPINGATMTLYVTDTSGTSTYGSAATVVTTAQTAATGSFNFTLPSSGVFCPAGEYAYIAGYGGNTGANSSSGTNTTTLLMAVVGACSTVYAVNAGVQTYIGNAVYVNELTTAVSAYALNNFMTVSSAGRVDIGAPKNNSATASAATPSAAGLAHAFANVTNMIVGYTGYPQASYAGRGGAIPTDQVYALGNILEACVNSNPTFTVTPSATANDGSACGQLFSLTTPPISGATTPVNTLQAMKNLAHYPLGNGTTWNGTGSGATATACTASTGGSLSAVQCLYNITYPNSFFQTAITQAPPDWSMSIGYATGYGVETTGCASTCSGLKYPMALALDYQDNVYVLNWSTNPSTTYINVVGLAYDGTPLFATANDTSANDLTMLAIGTDTAGHVFGVTPDTTGNQSLIVWNTSDGSVANKLTSTSLGSNSAFVLADPLNNINIISSQQGISMRRATYTAPSSYALSSISNSSTGGTSATGGPAAVSYGTNLDIFLLANPSAGPTVYAISNTGTYTKGTPAAATYGSSAIASVLLGGSIGSSAGITGLSTGNAMAINSAGITPVTKSGSTLSVGTAQTLTPVNGTSGTFRGTVTDGSNYVFAIDGAGGTYLSGATAFIPSSTSFTTGGQFLGTYRPCYIKTSTTTCGTDVNGTSSGTPAVLGPRGIGIDSAGDIWIASGVSANLTEIIGSAAPTWPGKSMGLQGLPQ